MIEAGYEFDPLFEKVVLYCCCTRPEFWRRIGNKLDPKRLQEPLAKYILAACGAVFKESGRPPSSAVIVTQHISRWHSEGRIKKEVVDAISDLFFEAAGEDIPPTEELVSEIVPIMRRKMQSEAVLLAHDEFAKRSDFTDTVSLLNKAARLGEVSHVDEVIVQASGMTILDGSMSDRLRTPSPELDIGLGGGLRRTYLGVVMAYPGFGKSMYLTNQAAIAAKQPMNVAFATLELPRAHQYARIVSCITDVMIDDLVDNRGDARKKAARILEETQDSRGSIYIADFEPYASTVRDLIEWVDRKEQESGSKISTLIIDYADKLDPPSQSVRIGDDYRGMRYVYEGARRDISVARDMWVWTASQPKNREYKDRKRLLDMFDVADSKHKYQACDLFLTINYEDPNDKSQAIYFVAKNRGGSDRHTIGPLPTDFARGRICF